MKSYRTLAHPVCSEVEIKKSRFLGCVEPISSHILGLERIKQIWSQHPDARHVCFVMLVQGQVRQSDDGEPSGTAARPMLNVLQHKGLDSILASVVRYFGGIKLGAGGLVRAYTQAISEPLQDAELIEVKPQAQAKLVFDYAQESLVRHLVDQWSMELELDYQLRVIGVIKGESEALESCLTQLNTQTAGQIQIERFDSPTT